MATTYTVGSGDIIRPWKGNGRIKYFPEAASQTFLRGDVVIIGGAGVENEVKIAADNPVANILGIAAEDASGTTGNLVGVYIPDAGAEFIGRTLSTDPVDFSDIGTNRALKIDSTNKIWVVDTSDAAHDAVVVLEYLTPGSRAIQTVEGDSSVWCVFRFIPDVTVYGPGTGQA